MSDAVRRVEYYYVTADILRSLAEAKISVKAGAAASAGGGRFGMMLWVTQASYDKAAKALGV